MPTKVHLVKAMVFPVVMYGCESWTIKKAEHWRIDAFELWSLEKTLESALDCKEIQPVSPKGNQSWIFIGRTNVEAETPILWLPDAKNWFIGKDPDSGKDSRWEEKGQWRMKWLDGSLTRWTCLSKFWELVMDKEAQRLKRLPPMRETWVRSLGREDPLEKEMATHSSILAWRIPWTEEPGRLQSTGSQRVGHDWVTSPHLTSPQGSLACCSPWGHKESDTTEWLNLTGQIL